jgi:hypothetical protein
MARIEPERKFVGIASTELSLIYRYTTNLSNNQTIESPFLDVGSYNKVKIICTTDKTGQLSLVWSSDGVSEEFQEFFYLAYENNIFETKVKARYLKVRYVNGSATTTFKLLVFVKV